MSDVSPVSSDVSKTSPAAYFAGGRRVQYAALPYRVRRDGDVQLRLITSRETRRWVIPKGWPMKGVSPPKAAAREAYEEAGLLGTISRKPLGMYTYEKRLGTRSVLCDVMVFPLKVKRHLQKWPERSQRFGFWFSVDSAASAVQEEELKMLILAFGDQMARKHEEKQKAAAAKKRAKAAPVSAAPAAPGEAPAVAGKGVGKAPGKAAAAPAGEKKAGKKGEAASRKAGRAVLSADGESPATPVQHLTPEPPAGAPAVLAREAEPKPLAPVKSAPKKAEAKKAVPKKAETKKPAAKKSAAETRSKTPQRAEKTDAAAPDSASVGTDLSPQAEARSPGPAKRLEKAERVTDGAIAAGRSAEGGPGKKARRNDKKVTKTAANTSNPPPASTNGSRGAGKSSAQETKAPGEDDHGTGGRRAKKKAVPPVDDIEAPVTSE